MTAARLGLRTNQKETIDSLQHQLGESQKLLTATRQELAATQAELNVVRIKLADALQKLKIQCGNK